MAPMNKAIPTREDWQATFQQYDSSRRTEYEALAEIIDQSDLPQAAAIVMHAHLLSATSGFVQSPSTVTADSPAEHDTETNQNAQDDEEPEAMTGSHAVTIFDAFQAISN